ncbi:MAG TPA: Holliday junction resolvase RuvX [Candidatus Acidoferrales bacterium]|nr:Holliday junction resolvase RuvX [Candidatus Acidoferrales bacterium]
MNAASKPAAAESRTRILAIDYGRRRIGIAVADSAVGIAEPLATLERVNRNEDMRRLRELAREHRVKQILVGLPLRLDGTRGEMAEEAERFAQRVRKQIGIPVQLVDERLSSWEAERKMEEEFGKQLRSLSRKKGESKISVDSIAAVVILREFLSAHQPAAEDI